MKLAAAEWNCGSQRVVYLTVVPIKMHSTEWLFRQKVTKHQEKWERILKPIGNAEIVTKWSQSLQPGIFT